MRFIHKSANRSIRCTLLGIRRHLRVRFLRPEKALVCEQDLILRLLTGEEDFLTAQQQSCL